MLLPTMPIYMPVDIMPYTISNSSVENPAGMEYEIEY